MKIFLDRRQQHWQCWSIAYCTHS